MGCFYFVCVQTREEGSRIRFGSFAEMKTDTRRGEKTKAEGLQLEGGVRTETVGSGKGEGRW